MSEMTSRDVIAINFLDALRPELEKLDIFVVRGQWVDPSLEIKINDYVTNETSDIWVSDSYVTYWYDAPEKQRAGILDLVIDNITFDMEENDMDTFGDYPYHWQEVDLCTSLYTHNMPTPLFLVDPCGDDFSV